MSTDIMQGVNRIRGLVARMRHFTHDPIDNALEWLLDVVASRRFVEHWAFGQTDDLVLSGKLGWFREWESFSSIIMMEIGNYAHAVEGDIMIVIPPCDDQDLMAYDENRAWEDAWWEGLEWGKMAVVQALQDSGLAPHDTPDEAREDFFQRAEETLRGMRESLAELKEGLVWG